MNRNSKNMDELKNIQNGIWTVLDDLRGDLRINDAISLILIVAAVAKTNRTAFETIYRAPKASLKNELIDKIESSIALSDIGSTNQIDKEHVSNDALQKVVYFVNEIRDFGLLAEILIEKIQGNQSKFDNENPCPKALVNIITELLGDVRKQIVYDGAAGICEITGNLKAKEMKLEEVNDDTRRLGNLLLLLRGMEVTIHQNDSFTNPGPSAQADWVVTQPPWGLRLSPQKREGLHSAEYLQFGQEKKIPASAGDALWIQHALYNMNESGKGLLILPQGWLFRGGYDAKLRAHLLDYDLIETLVALPDALFPHTSIPAALLILNKNKLSQHQGVVQMIDASDMGVREKSKRVLSAQEQAQIVRLCKGELPDSKQYNAVPLPDLYKNDNNLNISLYINKGQEIELPDYQHELEMLNQATRQFEAAQETLQSLLKEHNKRS